MAYNPTDFNYRILARFLQRLRAVGSIHNYVRKDVDSQIAYGAGESISIRKHVKFTPTNVVPGKLQPDPQDVTPEFIDVKLDQWKEVAIAVDDRSVSAIDKGVFDQDIESAVVSMSEAISASVYSTIASELYNSVGTPGTDPFAGGSVATFLAANQILTEQRAPRSGRVFIMDPFTENSALQVDKFVRADNQGTGTPLRTGEIGQAYGVALGVDTMVTSHTSTPLTAGAATVNGAHAAGVTTVSIAKATTASPLVKGDLLTFAGDTQTYVVAESVTLTVGNTAVKIAPALRTAKAGGEAVTLKASHVAMPFIHESAFTLVARPMRQLTTAANIRQVTDPATGITLLVETVRENYRDLVKISGFWGGKVTNPDMGVRVIR